MKLIILLISVLAASSGFADNCDLSSTSMSTQDHPCTFCTQLTCGASTGYVDNQTSLTALKVQAFSKSGSSIFVTLTKPPGTLYDYGSSDSNWVKGQLQARGISNPIYFLQAVTTSQTPKLYEDNSGKTPVGTSRSTSSDNGLHCDAVEDPYLITTPSCGKKVCVMRVACYIKRDGSVSSRMPPRPCAIEAVKGQCPTATACGKDESTSMSQTSVELDNGLHLKGGMSAGSAQ